MVFILFHKGVQMLGKGILRNTYCDNRGLDNTIAIDAGASLINCRILFKGNHNKLFIHCGTHLKNVTFWFEGNGNSIDVGGENVTMEGNVDIDACEGHSIIIGDDCMFSHGISVRTTDSHSIIDARGKRINPAKNISIGRHVWIGMDCLILKGTVIPENSIVGARSMVTSSLKATVGSLLAGSPARVIKNNVSWNRKLI